MKITFPDGLVIEADTLTEMTTLYGMVKPNISKVPAYKADPETGCLRLTYFRKYGKRFTAKGRLGSAVEFLTKLQEAGWPDNGSKLKTVA